MPDIDALLKAIGMDEANCLTCLYKGWDSPGSDDPCEPTWPVCEREENARFNNLKSFPFKKRMSCWYPDFWKSGFAERIQRGTDREITKLSKEFRKAVKDVLNV